MDTELKKLLTTGGLCGIVSVALYIVVIALPFPASQWQRSLTFLVATSWPLVGVVYSYALYRLIAVERQGVANRFAFILSLFALATVTAMIAIQLSVGAGVDELKQSLAGPVQMDWNILRRALRFVDFGLDLAWDLFIGWSMVVVTIPMYRHSRLGALWALPSLLLGVLLIGLNAATFPCWIEGRTTKSFTDCIQGSEIRLWIPCRSAHRE